MTITSSPAIITISSNNRNNSFCVNLQKQLRFTPIHSPSIAPGKSHVENRPSHNKHSSPRAAAWQQTKQRHSVDRNVNRFILLG